MLPWHEVLQQASKGRWKCVGWNKFPWIIHPSFQTDSEKGCYKLRHVPSAPEQTPPQQSKALLKFCTLQSSPTTATVSFDRPSPSLPQKTHPSQHRWQHLARHVGRAEGAKIWVTAGSQGEKSQRNTSIDLTSPFLTPCYTLHQYFIHLWEKKKRKKKEINSPHILT